MKCPNCQHPNRFTAQYCEKCGLALASSQQYIPLQPSQVMKSGEYTIERRLGKGGMGAVYLARQTIAGRSRHVVIKELLVYWDPNDRYAAQKAQQRFQSEAATLADLSHIGILKIFDYFSEGGHNYLAMEYIEGDDLEKGLTREAEDGSSIRGRPYPRQDVLRWGIQLYGVLEYLAAQNVVHHDIKPANIIIDRNSGLARLVDFGTASARLVKGAGGVGIHKSSIYGTVGYAPPEQIAGQSEPRSDVYGLAATLYHLLTDDRPDLLSYDFPRLQSLDDELKWVLASALENEVNQRATAAKMRRDLEALTSPATQSSLFTFRNGQTVNDKTRLARLCLQFRDEAKHYLYSDDFEHRFRGLGRADLLQAVTTARKESDQDAGLEVLVRDLAPGLSRARVRCPQRVGFGTLLPDQTQAKTIKVRNEGRECYLIGHIRSKASWLTVSQADFKLGPGEEVDLTLTVSTYSQDQGQALRTFLELETLFEQRTIPVQVRVAFPWSDVLKRAVIGAGVGSLLGWGASVALRIPVGGPGDWRWWATTIGLLAAILLTLRKGAPDAWRRIRRLGCLGWLLLGALLVYLTYLLRNQFWALLMVGGESAPIWAAVLTGGCLGAAVGVYRSLAAFNQRAGATLLSAGLTLLPLMLALVFDGQIAVGRAPDFLNMPVPYVSWESIPTPTPTRRPSPTPTRRPRPTSTPRRTPTATPIPPTKALASPTIPTSPTPTLMPVTPACPNPQAAITFPANGDTLSGQVDVFGSADIDRFDYYKFEFRPAGAPDWSFLVRFEQSVSEGPLMMWDTSTVPPGTYDLRLVVVDETGNYPEPCAIHVIVTR